MASASEIYQRAIMQLAAEAAGHGALAAPTASVLVDNPLCGDRVRIDIQIEEGRLRALAHEVKGCLLCRAAASIIGKHATGSTQAQLQSVADAVSAMLRDGAAPPTAWEELGAFAPVRDHPSRHRCVQLPFEALLAAMQSRDGQ